MGRQALPPRDVANNKGHARRRPSARDAEAATSSVLRSEVRRLFTGGEDRSFVYEYALTTPDRSECRVEEAPPGPVALVRLCLRCHVFGISVIQDAIDDERAT